MSPQAAQWVTAMGGGGVWGDVWNLLKLWNFQHWKVHGAYFCKPDTFFAQIHKYILKYAPNTVWIWEKNENKNKMCVAANKKSLQIADSANPSSNTICSNTQTRSNTPPNTVWILEKKWKKNQKFWKSLSNWFSRERVSLYFSLDLINFLLSFYVFLLSLLSFIVF